MPLYVMVGGVVASSILSLFFSTLTYSLREFSRQRLAEYLGQHDGDKWFEPITDQTGDLTFLTAVGRQFCNILIWASTFASFEHTQYPGFVRYGATIIVAGVIAVFCSITIPQAAARYAGAEVVGFFARILWLLSVIFAPVAKLMHGTDDIVRRALGAKVEVSQTQIDEEIMSVVEEGESQGVVDEREREMIESVIDFRDLTTGHIMTTRQEIIAIPIESTVAEMKQLFADSGHSRIPVYEGTIDHIVGVLYARDLLKFLGPTLEHLDIRATMRPAIYVPETKPLRDLLSDFRLQKVHMAIVLDEYGGTAGVVTIEDILEELVGEISDEHERAEPAMLKRIDDHTAEADARIHIEELNRLVGLSLPEDAEYETLGGYLSAGMARIPEKGAIYENAGAKFTVIDAEPQRVKRVRIEVMPEPATEAKTG